MDILYRKKKKNRNKFFEINEKKMAVKSKKFIPHPFPKSTFPKETILNWKTPEFVFHRKSPLWFLVGGLFFFSLISYFTYTKQLIAAFTFLLLSVTLYLFSQKKPRRIDCSISHQFISVDDKKYLFKEIHSFWIFYEPPDFKVISLRHKKPYLPFIQIPLGETNPAEVRHILLSFLTEEEQEETFDDKLARIIKF